MTELLTYAEVAERLHCSVRKVRRLVASGQIRVIRVGKQPLITDKEFEAYVAAAYRRAA